MSALSADLLRRRFDSAPEYRVGIEDELLVLDPTTFELAPRATEALAAVGDDPRFKLELPASQVEIVTPPCGSVKEAAAELAQARRDLDQAVNGTLRFAGAGVHPVSTGVGELNRGLRYDRIAREYGCIARRQVTCAFQVHVSVGDADRALAVYNAARSYLPLLAALAANAPFYEGADTGLASVRPKIAELLPRQGVPPEIDSWAQYCSMLSWRSVDRAEGADPATWWWELRPHAIFGTLEFRVPDGQSTISSAAGIAAVIQALVAWLGARHDAGESLGADPSWRINENRWSACRYGVEGTMAETRSGGLVPTRAVLERLLDALRPTAARLGSALQLELAHGLIAENGAMRQRRIGSASGVHAVAPWLVERFSAAQAG
jgi:glutamate---cysteine ligase / carboxylate-amine ligase